ncbi:MAG: hypothetical protein PHI63_06435 [Patescibacteria group bacterium]|nr:hypothetical protein [Patescibacteria group bacterium]
MLGQKKQERPKVAEAGVTVAPQVVDQIRVMPERFYLTPRKGVNRTFIIFGVLVIVVGGLVAVALWVWKFGPLPGNIPGGPVATATPVATPTAPAGAPTPSASATPAVPSPTPSVEPTETPTPSATPSGAIDEDNDGLTLNEERLYGTSPTNPDSDGDGYQDGAEVRNGYSPRVAGKTLVDDGQFQTESWALPYGFSLSFPSGWAVQQSLEGDVASLEIDSRLGERFTAVRYPASELPALQAQWGNVETQAVTINGLPAMHIAGTPSRYYFTTADQTAVVVLTYEAPAGQASFATTFEATVRSFRWYP